MRFPSANKGLNTPKVKGGLDRAAAAEWEHGYERGFGFGLARSHEDFQDVVRGGHGYEGGFSEVLSESIEVF